jgi:hypothetical protein
MRSLSIMKALAAGALAAGIAPVAAGAQPAQAAKQEKAATRQEPATLAISVPWQWLASSGGTMNFQCEANRPVNDEGVRMIEALGRGPKGRFSGKGDDGGTFTGTRRNEDFTFEAISKDGSKFALQMPWLAARCMFGGAKLAGAPSVELRAQDVGGRVKLEIAGQKKGVSVEMK